MLLPRKACVRLDDDLDHAFLLVVKSLVRVHEIVEINFVCDDESRINLFRLDHFHEFRPILLNRCLSRANRQSFLHHRTNRELIDETNVIGNDRDSTILENKPDRLW